MRDARVVLAGRFGAVVGFEDRNIVVIIIEAVEEPLARDFSSELHSEDVTVEASRRVKVADPYSHMAGTLYSHLFYLSPRSVVALSFLYFSALFFDFLPAPLSRFFHLFSALRCRVDIARCLYHLNERDNGAR